MKTENSTFFNAPFPFTVNPNNMYTYNGVDVHYQFVTLLVLIFCMAIYT